MTIAAMISPEHDAQMRALAAALIACTAVGDVDGVAALYHDDAVVWQNLNNREIGVDRVKRAIAWIANALEDMRYESIRITPTPVGFIQQHTLCGRSAGGDEIRAHVCFVAVVREGKFARIDEYLDSAAFAALS